MNENRRDIALKIDAFLSRLPTEILKDMENDLIVGGDGKAILRVIEHIRNEIEERKIK